MYRSYLNRLWSDIKVWMLTGDKLETAENIGKSCQLVQRGFSIMRIEAKDEKDPALFKLDVEYQLQVAKGIFEACREEGIPKALLVEGRSLSTPGCLHLLTRS